MSPSYRETLLQVGTAIKQDGHGFIQNMHNIQNLTVPVVVGNAFASGCDLPRVALLPFVIKCAE